MKNFLIETDKTVLIYKKNYIKILYREKVTRKNIDSIPKMRKRGIRNQHSFCIKTRLTNILQLIKYEIIKER